MADKNLSAAESSSDWLDVIPVLPLARGVPLTDGTTTGVVVVVPETDPRFAQCDGEVHTMDHGTLPLMAGWRVDLSNPQGFSYAHRLLLQLVSRDPADVDATPEYRRAFDLAHELREDHVVMRGEVTDRDRLALAKSLAALL